MSRFENGAAAGGNGDEDRAVLHADEMKRMLGRKGKPLDRLEQALIASRGAAGEDHLKALAAQRIESTAEQHQHQKYSGGLLQWFHFAPFCALAVDEVDSFLRQLVGRRDDAGVGLIAALEGQQVGEFGGDIDGGGFERSGDDLAAPARTGRADHRG